MRILFMTLALLATLGCQSTPLSYSSLIDKITNDEQVAIADLRAAFLESPDLSTRMQRLSELEEQAMQLVADQPLKLGSIGSFILDTYYGSLTGHYVSQRFYEHVESPEEAALHKHWLERIYADMKRAGDGSRTHPYPATTPIEAQTFATISGLRPVGSIYETNDAMAFGILILGRPEKGAIISQHFNVAALYRAVEQELENTETSQIDFNPFTLIGYLARRGDTAAQASIGAFLASQNRVTEATRWLRAASRKGNLLANTELARLFWQRSRQEDDQELKQRALDEVLQNYLHAIALGSSDAMYALGVLYLNKHYGEENQNSGVPLLQQAADVDHSDAALFLGHLYYGGEQVDKDTEKARSYYTKSAELNNPFARRSYARFLLDRTIEQPSDPRAITWLAELAKEEDSDAMLLLGNLHARGVSVKQNFRKAFAWFKTAVKTSPENAGIVNEVAWTLTVSNLDGLKRTRYALKIMETMMNSDKEAQQRPEYLDTWAAAYAANGDFGRAITLQQQAVEAAETGNNDDVLDILREHLEAFQNGKSITEQAP